MACVESSIPIANPRKKTDELFLSWLSEPSTQQLLRKELMKISGVPFSDVDENGILKDGTISQDLLSPSSAVTNVLRPGSPISIRTPSPPHGHPASNRSPNTKSSPRNSVTNSKSNRSPRKSAAKTINGVTAAGKVKSSNNSLQLEFDEVDSSENGGHTALVDSTNIIDGPVHRSDRDRRSRSHSPKPEALPKGQAPVNVPKLQPIIPRFYFPNGKPQPEENLQQRFTELSKLFATFENEEAGLKQFGDITKVIFIAVFISALSSFFLFLLWGFLVVVVWFFIGRAKWLVTLVPPLHQLSTLF